MSASFLDMAFEEAEAAAARQEVPVGAVLVAADGTVLSRNGNRILELKDPTAHAEILVIRDGARALGNERLTGCSLYVTLEPCVMCAGAISFARLARVEFAASDPKGGAVENGPQFFSLPTCHHRPEVISGQNAQRSASLLRTFFKERRKLRPSDSDQSVEG